MLLEKTNTEITPTIEARLEALAEFISEETAKSDNAANVSNWLIFEKYNREFNEIATQMGYDVNQDGNEDWTAVKLINSQIVAPDWYEGKSRAWLQQARRILRVACDIYQKCIADNALDELQLSGFSYEQCRLIANNSLPLEEKRELWQWMERDKPTCRKLRIAIRDRVEAHKHLEGSTAREVDEDEANYQPRLEPLEEGYLSAIGLLPTALRAIASEVISKVKSDEIVDAEKLIEEIALRVRQH